MGVQIWSYIYTDRQDFTEPAQSAFKLPTGGVPVTSESLSLYKHRPLPNSHSIRILRICPSLSSGSPVQCEMLCISLVGGFHPPYAGISYRWDPEGSEQETIYINGRPFQVYSSVYSILKHMRSKLRKQCVWIDSVCINQSDDEEKAKQVLLMRVIYENCSYLVGWLGGSAQRSNILDMDLYSDEGTAVRMITRINASKYLQNITDHDNISAFIRSYSLQEWRALERLIANPWFTRVWVSFSCAWHSFHVLVLMI
jgi:hypothetical protein